MFSLSLGMEVIPIEFVHFQDFQGVRLGTVPLIDRVSPVYHQSVPLDERGLWRAQEQHSISDFLRCPHSLHGSYINSGLEASCHFLRSRRHGRGDNARADTVHANAFPGVVNGVCACHVDNGGLGGAIRRFCAG